MHDQIVPILLCACSVQGQQTKRHDEAQDGVMIIRDDGYPEPGLHDVQHPAQNTLASPGPWAAISMGRERERQQRQMSRRAERGAVGTKTLLHARDTL